jgi:N-acetylglutamate synthase-like GNAT family acetyltransferase
MIINNRSITKDELNEIYDDFKRIEKQDGVPDPNTNRYEYIAEENDKVVGYVSGLTNHKWFYLTDLWIHEGYRRRGWGTTLLIMLEDKVRSIGIKHIYTWTSGFINPVFYEKHGYKVFTIFEDFFEVAGYHQIGYQKNL